MMHSFPNGCVGEAIVFFPLLLGPKRLGRSDDGSGRKEPLVYATCSCKCLDTVDQMTYSGRKAPLFYTRQ